MTIIYTDQSGIFCLDYTVCLKTQIDWSKIETMFITLMRILHLLNNMTSSSITSFDSVWHLLRLHSYSLPSLSIVFCKAKWMCEWWKNRQEGLTYAFIEFLWPFNVFWRSLVVILSKASSMFWLSSAEVSSYGISLFRLQNSFTTWVATYLSF